MSGFIEAVEVRVRAPENTPDALGCGCLQHRIEDKPAPVSLARIKFDFGTIFGADNTHGASVGGFPLPTKRTERRPVERSGRAAAQSAPRNSMPRRCCWRYAVTRYELSE